MRFTIASGVRNDLLQEITNDTTALIAQGVVAQASLDNLEVYNQAREFGANPLVIHLFDTGQAAAHGFTLRASYLVPPNRRAVLSGVHFQAEWYIVPAPLAVSTLRLQYQPNGGVDSTLFTLTTITSIIGDWRDMQLNTNMPLNAGDFLRFTTIFGGGVGNGYWSGNFAIVEYDA